MYLVFAKRKNILAMETYELKVVLVNPQRRQDRSNGRSEWQNKWS